MIGHPRQGFAQPIGEGLLVVAVGAHLVGLIDDDEIPLAPQQRFLGVFYPRNPGNRSDDLVLFLPGIHPVIGAEHVATDDLEALAELVFELPLPLEGEVGRRHDKGPLD